ncbi:hypothetical protein O4G76_18605, partial [Limimaricola sp. G21655-S1]|uniref:hypothetical protein n=1 Tax=Limimaricola sp. G21655-S1 TaxID=3014768 RepID=UPI0022B01A00
VEIKRAGRKIVGNSHDHYPSKHSLKPSGPQHLRSHGNFASSEVLLTQNQQRPPNAWRPSRVLPQI